MEYFKAKATVTPTTDLGEFRALVATYDRDRTGDEIKSGAFSDSISEWREVGRRVPLHWNHEADSIIGDIDPEEMRETDDGFEVSGHIDLDDELGRKVWKSLKKNRIGFSFGYVTTRSEKRGDGGLNLLQVDLYEVSATPSPMNSRTRILSTKSATATATETLTEDNLRDLSLKAAREALASTKRRDQRATIGRPSRGRRRRPRSSGACVASTRQSERRRRR